MPRVPQSRPDLNRVNSWGHRPPQASPQDLANVRTKDTCPQFTRRLYPQQPAVVRQEVDVAMGTLFDIANAQARIVKKMVSFNDLAIAADLHAIEVRKGHTACEHLAPPSGKGLATIETEARRADRGGPLQPWWRNPLFLRAPADLRAMVLAAIGHHRPTVVEARQNHVDLVATARATLGGPGSIRARPEREALRISVPIAPERKTRALAAHARIIGGNRAVVADAVHLAGVDIKALREIALTPMSDGEVDVALALRCTRQSK